MNAEALPYRRPEPALGPSLALSVIAHSLLIAILFLGVRFTISPSPVVSVELWDPPPPPPQPVVEEKPPAPPPPVVKPEPEPEVKKPEIALPEKPKPKPKPEVKPEPKPKPVPKRDLAFEKQLREQALREQQELQKLEEQRRERERKEMLAKLAADARNKAIAQWTDKIRIKVRGNIILPQNIPGNPEAIFDVAILPTGQVLTVRKRRSSGHAAYDDAVERAIEKSSPLPLPDDRSLFQRELELRFRPQDR